MMGVSALLSHTALAILAIALVCLHPGWIAAQTNKVVMLATTTSTRDSGLLDVLLPVFEQQTSYSVKTIAVGTGQALAMGKRGDADVLLTHAPEAEKPLVTEGWVVDRVPFMYNDFVMVGPVADPAQVGSAQSAAEAFKRIAEQAALFISRGDQSGTHKQEQTLWQASTVVPGGAWYIEAGQGMGATLRIASEKAAYTLTDRSTYLHLQKTLTSTILYAGDPVLRNIYSIMRVNPDKHGTVNAAGAQAFHAWLLGDTARQLIRQYGVAQFGQPLFYLEARP
jgi:tungstate transport system substrate-binding protein